MKAGQLDQRTVAEAEVGGDIIVVDKDGGNVSTTVDGSVAETLGPPIFADCLAVKVGCTQRAEVFVCTEECCSLAQRQLVGDKDDDFVWDL